MPPLFFILKSLYSGKTLVRTLLEYRLSKLTFKGEVLDLGSGGTDQYTKFIPREEGTRVILFDQKKGEECDFEKDALPYSESQFETILFLNVLEHIYNHRHILKEINRIKQDSGTLIGFVPFLKWYHADPRDFFRYTHEALEKLLHQTSYSNVTVEGLYLGPYSTAFDMILPTLPKFIRPVLYVPCFYLDVVFRKLRPAGAKRYVLGYFFTAQ